MPKLSISIGNTRLKNPVMVASGTFGYAKEFEKFIDLKKLGAIVTKTVTLRPISGNPMPRICETSAGMLNSIGLQNEGVENFIKEKLPYLSKIGVPIIVSISGEDIKEFCRLVELFDKEKGVKAIELNLSCPNIAPQSSRFRPHNLIAQSKNDTYKVVNKVRCLTKKTIITKLSPNVTDIVEIARSACRAGTDAVSLVNTFFAMAIDIETRKPRLGNIIGGLSGPCIKPIALRMVWEVAKNIKKPVIGIGGIMEAKDAIEFIIAGSTAVQIGTANFISPDISGRIIKGIEKYLRDRKIEDISEITGKIDT